MSLTAILRQLFDLCAPTTANCAPTTANCAPTTATSLDFRAPKDRFPSPASPFPNRFPSLRMVSRRRGVTARRNLCQAAPTLCQGVSSCAKVRLRAPTCVTACHLPRFSRSRQQKAPRRARSAVMPFLSRELESCPLPPVVSRNTEPSGQ